MKVALQITCINDAMHPDTGKAVVMGAGILKADVKYDEIVDMSFVESLRASI